MSPIRSSLLLLPLVFLCACAAMEEDYRNQICHREVGFERGTNDGQEGKPMDTSFSNGCDPIARKEVMAGYREGYQAARNESTLEADDDGIRVKAPGIDIRMGKKNSQAWMCEVSPFTKSYSGFGSSRAQAAQAARLECEKHHNSMHCGDAECKENR